jgi:FMN phosphatase YigB (HAD superfamily)
LALGARGESAWRCPSARIAESTGPFFSDGDGVKAVLFDLDGTLLDIDIDAFLGQYFTALGPVVVEVIGGDPHDGIRTVMAATREMIASHPGRTNEEVFAEAFSAVSGVELGPESWAHFDRFYEEVFPTLRGTIGPSVGAAEAVATARQLGMKTVVATNPIFPAAAIRERMSWAGVADVPFDLVTTYEIMNAAKPDLDYYRSVAATIQCEPCDCLMVGDDATLDMVAADIGMRTYYVGPKPAPAADYVGTLTELVALLPRVSKTRC